MQCYCERNFLSTDGVATPERLGQQIMTTVIPSISNAMLNPAAPTDEMVRLQYCLPLANSSRIDPSLSTGR